MREKIGVQVPHNKRMQEFLRNNGFPFAVPWYIEKGSMKGTWRIYCKQGKEWLKWSNEAAEKLTSLGFTDTWGSPLSEFSGNGGYFQVFVRGHNEFLREAN